MYKFGAGRENSSEVIVLKRLGLYLALLLIFIMSVLPLYSLIESLRIGKIPQEVTRLHMNTNNTTRVWANDYQELQKKILQIKNPEGSSPDFVILVSSLNWVNAVTAASLLAPPINSALMLVDTNREEEVLKYLGQLNLKGEGILNGAQVLAVGEIADTTVKIQEEGYRVEKLTGDNAAIAQKIDKLRAALTGQKSPWVILIDPDMDFSYSLPAINWSVHRGTPTLVLDGEQLPTATKNALKAREKNPSLYIVGPPDNVSGTVKDSLNELGTVKEIGHNDPVQNAIEFARFYDENTGFGWQTTPETVEGGKNFLLVKKDDWQSAVIGSQIFNKGLFGPLLLTSEANRLPAALEKFYFETSTDWWVTPAEGPYNHTWLLGSTDKISYPVQGRLNFLQEITNYENQGNQGISGLEALTIVWYAFAVCGAIWTWFHLSTRLFQLPPFMKIIWVLVVLSLGVVGLWAYYTCYKGYGHQVASGEFPRPLWVKVLAATCSTIGTGMPTMIGAGFILVFLGAPLLLNRGPLFVLTGPMFQTVFWSYVAAIIINAFIFVPIMLAFKENSRYWDTIKANWLTVVLSMTAISIGMMSTMWWIMMEYLAMMPEEANLLWWGSMYAANIVGLLTGYIGNWALVIRGEKKGTM